MIIAEPEDIPVTTPLSAFIAAIPELLLDQNPPDTGFVSVPDEPTQILEGPEIEPGRGFMVTVVLVKHPVAKL